MEIEIRWTLPRTKIQPSMEHCIPDVINSIHSSLRLGIDIQRVRQWRILLSPRPQTRWIRQRHEKGPVGQSGFWIVGDLVCCHLKFMEPAWNLRSLRAAASWTRWSSLFWLFSAIGSLYSSGLGLDAVNCEYAVVE